MLFFLILVYIFPKWKQSIFYFIFILPLYLILILLMLNNLTSKQTYYKSTANFLYLKKIEYIHLSFIFLFLNKTDKCERKRNGRKFVWSLSPFDRTSHTAERNHYFDFECVTVVQVNQHFYFFYFFLKRKPNKNIFSFTQYS